MCIYLPYRPEYPYIPNAATWAALNFPFSSPPSQYPHFHTLNPHKSPKPPGKDENRSKSSVSEKSYGRTFVTLSCLKQHQVLPVSV